MRQSKQQRLRALEVAAAERHPADMSEETEARLAELVNYAEVHGREAAAEVWPYSTRVFEILDRARERRDRHERKHGSTAQRA